MLVTIPDLLDDTQLAAIRAELDRGHFVDGKLSAGQRAAVDKRNLELAPAAASFEALNNVVMTRLVQNPLYLQAALPAKICAPIYARYTAGMEYGYHIDDPVMGPPAARYRSDIAITIFLNSPHEYEGGELLIELPHGNREVKLPAGHAVLYPASSCHAVKPLLAGERLVAVTWVQSLVRRADQREILLRLDRARETLSGQGQAAALQHLDLCYANLIRMWAEI
jgi:PKHD-type hydroxylase